MLANSRGEFRSTHGLGGARLDRVFPRLLRLHNCQFRATVIQRITHSANLLPEVKIGHPVAVIDFLMAQC